MSSDAVCWTACIFLAVDYLWASLRLAQRHGGIDTKGRDIETAIATETESYKGGRAEKGAGEEGDGCVGRKMWVPVVCGMERGTEERMDRDGMRGSACCAGAGKLWLNTAQLKL